jgi:hypothetical protein
MRRDVNQQKKMSPFIIAVLSAEKIFQLAQQPVLPGAISRPFIQDPADMSRQRDISDVNGEVDPVQDKIVSAFTLLE